MPVHVLPAARAGMLLNEFHQPLSHGYFLTEAEVSLNPDVR